jgi:hypothetical protein
MYPEEGKVGNGTLLTVTFKAEEIGTSNLTFTNLIFLGPYSQIYDVTAFHGFVEVTLPDFNNDGKVDTTDLTTVVQAFGSRPSEEGWNSTCDVNRDSIINIIDVAITARAFGKTD